MAKVNYSEPSDYIPKSVRKQLGLGEYAPAEKKKSASKKKPAKKSK